MDVEGNGTGLILGSTSEFDWRDQGNSRKPCQNRCAAIWTRDIPITKQDCTHSIASSGDKIE